MLPYWILTSSVLHRITCYHQTLFTYTGIQCMNRSQFGGIYPIHEDLVALLSMIDDHLIVGYNIMAGTIHNSPVMKTTLGY